MRSSHIEGFRCVCTLGTASSVSRRSLAAAGHGDEPTRILAAFAGWRAVEAVARVAAAASSARVAGRSCNSRDVDATVLLRAVAAQRTAPRAAFRAAASTNGGGARGRAPTGNGDGREKTQNEQTGQRSLFHFHAPRVKGCSGERCCLVLVPMHCRHLSRNRRSLCPWTSLP
jgi:hypothetical protein